MDDDREFIGEVSKNSMETVKVHISRFKGKVYVDARVFTMDDAGSGAEGPTIATKKGLCLSPDVMLELLPLLSQAQEMASKIAEGER